MIKRSMTYLISSLHQRALLRYTLSMMQSVSKETKVSFSIAINIKASRCSSAVLLNRFLINFRVEKLRSHATCVTDRVNRNLYQVRLDRSQ